MNRHQCPHCGQQLGVTLVKAASAPAATGWRRLGVLQHAVSIPGGAAPEPAFGDYQKTTPVSRLEPRDVLTAGLDAGVSFGLITIAGAGACWYLEWPLVLAPAGGLAVAIWRYFDGLALARGLLEIVETITGKDINRDGVTGHPPAKNEPMRFEVTVKNEAGLFLRMFRFDLPKEITPALFNKWAAGVLMRDDLTQERWVNNDDFIRQHYNRLLDKLEEAQIVYRTSAAKNAAYKLTRHGKNVLKLYLQAVSDAHSHSLTQGVGGLSPEYHKAGGE